MAKPDPFYFECYEILNQERPAVVLAVAELVAAGVSPIQVRSRVSDVIQNPSSTIPSLAENTAYYFRGLVPVVAGSGLSQVRH
jgi:hypothetical protein